LAAFGADETPAGAPPPSVVPTGPEALRLAKLAVRGGSTM
jgi:hypothetical protein